MMGDGPSLDYMQRLFWAFTGAAIGVAAATHLYNLVLSRQRRVAAHSSLVKEIWSAPQNMVTSTVATWTAVVREVSEALPPLQWTQRLPFAFPPLGRIFFVLAELAVVLVLCFYMLNPNNAGQWEDVAYRCGYIGLAQLPLIFLLAGKNNIIGVLTGTSYERLNWLHRWAARILFLTVTLHLSFWLADWGQYHYITTKFRHSKMARQGLTAWSILLWINLSSLAPIRQWNYEVFVIQHIVSYAAFTAMVYIHVDGYLKNWVWVSIALLLFDRSLRLLRFIYINLSIFHSGSGPRGLWSCKATFEPMAQGMTRIRVRNPPIRWSAGQHAMLSCHSIAPLQAHPFTIASIPEDEEMTFLVKTKKGGTKRFFKHAEKQQQLPFSTGDQGERHCSVAIEGPYGRIRNLRQFDSVVLIAGASGATFTVPLMRDVVASWSERKIDPGSRWYNNHHLGTVTRHVRFVWVIKAKDQFGWFSEQFSRVMHDVQKLKNQGHDDLEVDMSIYITCDERFITETGSCEKKEGKPMDDRVTKDGKQQNIIRIQKGEKEGVTVKETLLRRSFDAGSRQRHQEACRPDGTCCCKAMIDEEDQISSSDQAGHECNCAAASTSTSISTSTSSGGIPQEEGTFNSETESEKKSLVVDSQRQQQQQQPGGTGGRTSSSSSSVGFSPHPDISIFSGRPNARTVILKVLEQALGESAVVVCGPPGLVADVRRSVVGLSDERAVHRGGTGAQGIYLHTEAFDF